MNCGSIIAYDRPRSERQKIREQLFALPGENRLRVKLHSMQWELSMFQAHYPACSRSCADCELIRQSLRRDDEGMITRGGKWIWQSSENARPIVMDLRGFAVHQPLRANNLSAKNFRDALVTQANTEQGHARREAAHDFFAYSRFGGSSRPGRDANMCRL